MSLTIMSNYHGRTKYKYSVVVKTGDNEDIVVMSIIAILLSKLETWGTFL